jgi:hypothetical protein
MLDKSLLTHAHSAYGLSHDHAKEMNWLRIPMAWAP